jgi:hypothetical protein
MDGMKVLKQSLNAQVVLSVPSVQMLSIRAMGIPARGGYFAALCLSFLSISPFRTYPRPRSAVYRYESSQCFRPVLLSCPGPSGQSLQALTSISPSLSPLGQLTGRHVMSASNSATSNPINRVLNHPGHPEASVMAVVRSVCQDSCPCRRKVVPRLPDIHLSSGQYTNSGRLSAQNRCPHPG